MNVITRALTGAATLAIVGGMSATAFAQEVDQADDAIVVTGIRASLESAQERKRTADAIVDSIVADDIGKLPDSNTTEALQRISGIQVGRDRGEGGSVAIRGLTQVLTTMNGRDIFTAGGGRGFNLQDFPSELLGGIDVYKTPTADLIEGGIGGVIDLRTRKPLDFDGFALSGSVRGRYETLAKKVDPLVSALISDRWNVGGGEMGVLLSGSFQERSFRSDVISNGAPSLRSDVIAGQKVYTPNGDYEPLINGKRRRIGLQGAFQWKPNPDLEIFAEAGYQEFRSLQQQRGLNNPTNGRAVEPGSVTLYDGTDHFKSGTFLNVPITTYGVQRDTYDKNQQYSIGAKQHFGESSISAEFTYQKSTNELYYSELDLATVLPKLTIDTSGKVPSALVSGIDLSDINNYTVGPLTRSENHYKGDSYAGRVDGDFKIDSGFLTNFKTGVRYQKLSTSFDPIRFYQAPAAGTSAAPFADLFESMPFKNYFGGTSRLEHDYLTAITSNLGNAADWEKVRQAIGLTNKPAVDPKSVYDMTEETVAGYAQLVFGTSGALPIDGNVGVRVVKTQLDINGNQSVGGVIQPAIYSTDYVSVLPSANMRVRFTDQLQLRLAASQSLTRPNFSQLSPALTLVPAQGQGSGGNPNLKPLRADALDASLEYYFSGTGSLYLAGFYRKVKGFVFTNGNTQTIDGIEYVITQPTNGKNGEIKGLEVGGQTFFDFLPGPFNGFGIQANYTYVDSSTPAIIATELTPLPGLSKHSFNLAGLYEKGGLSARVAYNYRSKYLGSIYGLSLGAGVAPELLPVYTKGYGWLDASIGYDITKQITVTLEGSNLLQRREFTYYGSPTRPNGRSIDDRQIMAGIRFKL
ncbi:TonB-dependent receptor [Hephaestia sp. GCM10023244]|uniref:TonB-dependent receptor n=1 Tax=unclassified Hephaestia TaxID=2631281 RepID=UPI002077695A|nr:TonB-dependent receptor [Hephaestia sp. MAHUQ-44]MCM8730528.1 TonB-dependent receptor [Hephaestia sp. MAHUQ-44]